jgi:hypothetical protein
MAEIPKGFADSVSEPVEDAVELSNFTQRGTDTDEYEMRMLGRTQQLNVPPQWHSNDKTSSLMSISETFDSSLLLDLPAR